MGTPRAVKSQAIANLLAQFLEEEEFPLNDEVPGEVAVAEKIKEQWVMKFDGSSTTQSRGVGVVLYHEEKEAVALSFKLEFPCCFKQHGRIRSLPNRAGHGSQNGS